MVEPNALIEEIRRARKRLLQMHFDSGVGHIGGNLSCLDLLMSLYHGVLQPDDAFVLSKGHAAGALYVTLWSKGALSEEDLRLFHKDGTHLSGHPPPDQIPDVLFATGSLGHGLSLSCGLALARKLTQRPGRVYCLMSDGEWQEGSNWEALIFAAHHKLPVTFLVDANGLQGFGSTASVAGMADLTHKLRAFHLPVLEIDGHDPQAIISHCLSATSGPLALVAQTRKGSRISFMQDKMEWHYLPMSEAHYQQALEDIAAL